MTSTRSTLLIVHDPAYAGWAFNPSHPTQGRRFVNGYEAIQTACASHNLEPLVMSPGMPDRKLLARVHTDRYVSEVIDNHHSGEWHGERSDLAHLAQLFVGGTLTALDALLAGRTRTAIHLPGAKHHAQANASSGFCVFADFALAALIARDAGHRVAILDIDAHHGDGTENLVGGSDAVLTFSVHQLGIFPGTGNSSEPTRSIYNIGLHAGDADDELIAAVETFINTAAAFRPTMIFIAAGADGLRDDPLTGLHYTVQGLAQACSMVRHAYPALPFLMGGAGGYLPDTGTPEAWSAMAIALAQPATDRVAKLGRPPSE
jgi:acetoin utilization protein AcuC